MNTPATTTGTFIPRPLAPEKKPEAAEKAVRLASEVGAYGERLMTEANDLVEYMVGSYFAHKAAPENFEWIYAMGSEYDDYGMEDVISEFDHRNERTRLEAEAMELRELFLRASSIPETPDQIRIALKEVDSKILGSDPEYKLFAYRAIAILPIQAEMGTADEVLYLVPQMPCTKMSCRDVLAEQEAAQAEAGYIPYLSLKEAYELYAGMPSQDNIIEYYDVKHTHADGARDYLRMAIYGMFNNERKLYRIPTRLLRAE